MVGENRIITNYFDALLAGRRKEAQQYCIDFLNAGNSIKKLYENLMQPALYKIGKLWEENKITVATEHMATAISEGILNTFYSEIVPDKYNGKKVVLACVEKEEHQVGVKMVADIFEMHEWESFFLGTGFPTSELINYIDEINPDIIAISLSVYFNFARLQHMILEIKNKFPTIKIIIGGQALSYVSNRKISEWNDITYIDNLDQLETYLDKYK